MEYFRRAQRLWRIRHHAHGQAPGDRARRPALPQPPDDPGCHAKSSPGASGYSVWCNDQGRVIDDGTIFHLKEGVYRICSQEHQIDWFMTSARGLRCQYR